MKLISQLRSEIASRSPVSEGHDSFGENLVGRLLSMDEVDVVVGGDGGACGYPNNYTQSGGSYTQNGGSYTQSSGSYTMTC